MVNPGIISTAVLFVRTGKKFHNCKGVLPESYRSLVRKLRQTGQLSSKPEGASPLYQAIHSYQEDIAVALIQAGCRLKEEKHVMPLICKAAHADMTNVVMELCMKNDYNMFATDNNGWNFVHIAVHRKNYDLLKRLKPYCHYSYAKYVFLFSDKMFFSPLHLAAYSGDVTALRLLLQLSGIDDLEMMQKNKYSFQDVSESHSWLRILSDQLQMCDKMIKLYETRAMVQERLKITQQLFDEAADHLKGNVLTNMPTGDSLETAQTMLHLAIKKRHVEMVEFLVRHGAYANYMDNKDNYPIYQLLMNGTVNQRSLKIARIILDAGAHFYSCVKIHRVGRYYHRLYPATDAAMRNLVGTLKVIKECRENKFSRIDNYHRTPLMWALLSGSEEAAWFLLTQCPQNSELFTLSDFWNVTALHYVSNCRSKGGLLTKLLLDQGYVFSASNALPDRCCRNGCRVSPVLFAIKRRNLEVLKAFCDYNPMWLPKYSDTVHTSPLHVAVKYMPGEECRPFIDFLLAHGCDGNAVVEGKPAYDYKDSSFAADYLRNKLGACVLQPTPGLVNTYHFHDFNISGLKNICLERVRRILRRSQDDYHCRITSLEIPPILISQLLFEF